MAGNGGADDERPLPHPAYRALDLVPLNHRGGMPPLRNGIVAVYGDLCKGIVMSAPYQIIEVQPEWVLEPEGMGSKQKFWYRPPDQPERKWLFKYPQPDTGQHWAEKIAAEVADLLTIPHAKVELAVFLGERGSVTESFARGGRELTHGNQMLARAVRGYDPGGGFRQSDHTLANIWEVMDRVFLKPEAARRAKLCIAEYVVLDALIGNTDRHHENWGILWRRTDNGWKGFVAPSFDHASSLGRELLDKHRDRRLAESRVGGYVEKGRGAIHWSEDEAHGPSPLELVRRAAPLYPDLFRPALEKLKKLAESPVNDLVNCVPDTWISPSARAFAIELTRYNLEQLRGILS